MKVLLLLLSFLVSTLPESPKSVNLQLITSFLINPNDVRNNASYIQSMRSFINELQEILSPGSGYFRTGAEPVQIVSGTQTFILSEFFEGLRRILLSYNDAELKSVVEALCKVIQDYFYQQSVFHEVFADNLKHFIKDVVQELSETDITVLRNELNGNNKTSLSLHGIIKKLDIFYTTDDEQTLQKILNKFKKYPMKRKNLYNTIKHTLQFLIFDRYNKLNETSKHLIGKDLNEIGRYLKFSNDLKAAFLKSKAIVQRAKGHLEKLNKYTTESQDKKYSVARKRSTQYSINNKLEKKGSVYKNTLTTKHVDTDVSLDTKDSVDTKQTVDVEDSQDSKDNADSKNIVDTEDSQDSKDNADSKNIVDTEDSQDSKDNVDSENSRETEDSPNEKHSDKKQMIDSSHIQEILSSSESHEKIQNKKENDENLLTLRDLEKLMKNAFQEQK